MDRKFERCPEFWHHYLREHSGTTTRALHYVGTAIAITLLIAAPFFGNGWMILGAVVAGYLFA
jgi:hypothetical protein